LSKGAALLRGGLYSLRSPRPQGDDPGALPSLALANGRRVGLPVDECQLAPRKGRAASPAIGRTPLLVRSMWTAPVM